MRSATTNKASLPAYIAPMLAKPAAKPFDSSEYMFEVKWDGTRAMTYIDAPGRLRLLNRRRLDITWRYPELSFMAEALPTGTVLDGEVVVLDAGGKPDFSALQSREQARTALRVKGLVKMLPATYVIFDQLYRRGASIMHKRCVERRRTAARTVRTLNSRRVVMSEGVTKSGIEYFRQVESRGLEGIVAKRLDSPYAPGQRTNAWQKIKRSIDVPCVIIGFEVEGKDDFAALVLAAQDESGNGDLAYVGKVGTGFNAELRRRINAELWPHVIERPVVPCKLKARWVEPRLYCIVRCLERTAAGQLRAPVFGKLLNAR